MEKLLLENVIEKISTGLNPRKNFNLNDGGTNKYITIKNIKNGKLINLESCDLVNDDALFLINKRSDLKKGDILLSSIGATGDSFIIDESQINWNINESVFSIRPSLVSSKYLYYMLKSPLAIKYYESVQTGSTFKSIKISQLKKMPINLYNEKEQKDITCLFDNIELMIETRINQIEDLEKLIFSKFDEMFGKLSKTKFETKTLSELVSEEKNSLKRGPFGGSLKKDDFVEIGYLVYEQKHAIHNDFNYEKYFIDQKKYKEMEAFKVEPGELIVSCSGTIGKISEIPKNAKPGIINQALLKIKLNNNVITNNFFIYMFRHPEMQKTLHSFSRGSGIPNFPSMKELKEIKFICPSLEKQLEFSDYVENVNQAIYLLKNDIKDLKELLRIKMYEYFS